MRRLHEQLRVRVHERDGHRHGGAVRQHEVVAVPEFLDHAEDVVPAARVQARRVLAQLVEDLLHLERGEDRLDQDGAANRPGRDADLLLCERERVGPEARLEMRLELREVEVRPAAPLELLAGVARHVQPEVEERGRDRLAVDERVALRQVPAAGPDQERRDLLVQPVCLVGRLERDVAVYGVGDVSLPLDDVFPLRRARVLVVGHEDAGTRVERVDHHLPVDRARDLATPVLQVGRRGRDAPVPLANSARLCEERRIRAGVELALSLPTALEQLEAGRVELAMEALDERERLPRQDVAQANCASSDEPLSASVELSGEIACITRSKYRAPTSRWWRVGWIPNATFRRWCRDDSKRGYAATSRPPRRTPRSVDSRH